MYFDILNSVGNYERFIKYKVRLTPLRQTLYNLYDLENMEKNDDRLKEIRFFIRNIHLIIGGYNDW